VLWGGGLPGYAVEVDGVRLADDAVIVTVANVETYAGFLPLTRAASPTDGLLDVFAMTRASRRAVILRLLRLFFRLPGRWRGARLARGRRIVVSSAAQREVLSVRARALPLVVPAGTLDRFASRAAGDALRSA
jgi:diacylglycerol kinase family enzyme